VVAPVEPGAHFGDRDLRHSLLRLVDEGQKSGGVVHGSSSIDNRAGRIKVIGARGVVPASCPLL
jgi:hypothetical protein